MTSTLISRSKRNLHIVAILVVIAELAAAEYTLAQTTGYIISELGAGQVPSRLNNLGDFVGKTGNSIDGETRAAAWNHRTLKAKHLGTLPGGEYSIAFAINDAGYVAGSSNTGDFIVPFIWEPAGGLKRIPLLPGDSCGQGFAINKHGHVVGYSSGPNGVRAFLWIPKTGVRHLESLPGAGSSRARAVNDSDEVAGTSVSPTGDRAVLWTPAGHAIDLGTLPGDSSSEAMAINAAGDVVGYSKGRRGLRAFLWTKGGGMEELGVLPGGRSSRALDINNSGVVVGSSETLSGDHAFIWRKQTGMVDLNDTGSAAALAAVLIEANAINTKGEILAMGKMVHGTMPSQNKTICAPAPPLSFLLTPIASP
jgi:probable HAF family extracellular repeat protein